MSFSEWREIKLEDCTKAIFSGGTPSTKKNEYWGGSIPWLSSGETRNTFIYETEKRITDKGVKNSSTKLAKINDVVIASAGQGNTRGQASLCKIDTFINQSIIALRSAEGMLDSSYLFYNIKNRYSELRKISDGHSIRGSLTTKIIKQLKIKLPPMNEQKAIAHTLSTLDEKIEVNNRINKTLEEIAQEIFKHWFVDFEFPNEDGEPYKSSGGEMVESELGAIPKGWEIGCINDIASNKKDSVRSNDLDENDNYIGLEHVPRKQLFLDNWGSSSDITSNKYRFEKGNILFGKLRPYFHKVVFAPIDGICSTDILVIISKKKLYYPFLLMNLFSEEVIDYANAVSTGTRMPRVNWNNIGKFKIVVPDEETLNSYSTILNPIIDKFYDAIQENRILASIRDTLLPKLMSGEIRVPLDTEEQ